MSQFQNGDWLPANAIEARDSGIRVAAYMTELPPREILQKKLHDAVRFARARLDSRGRTPE